MREHILDLPADVHAEMTAATEILEAITASIQRTAEQYVASSSDPRGHAICSWSIMLGWTKYFLLEIHGQISPIRSGLL